MDSLLNPRTAYRWGLRVAVVCGATAVLLLLSWGFRLHDALGARPTLTLMLFMLFLLVAVGSGAVAIISATQLAIHKAFIHGYSAGAQRAAGPTPDGPGLRVVPRDDGGTEETEGKPPR
jgi:hypothetical protein